MASIPAKAAERIRSGLKRFQPILAAARARDINESDTVVIVTDLLQDIFGYDKYSEITSEHMVRATFCDLAVKIDGTLAFLLEVKAIGLDLKDNHVKQAVDYAANQGVEWVGLTNGVVWRIYKVHFTKPIQNELVLEIDLTTLNTRDADAIDLLALLAKEGLQKSRLGEYHSKKLALSRFTLGAILLSEPVLDVVRRELRRTTPGMKVDNDEIKLALGADVIKREVIEGDQATAAQKQLARAAGRALRRSRDDDSAPGSAAVVAPTAVPDNGQ